MNEDGDIYRKSRQRWNEPWQAHELTFSCLDQRALLSRDRTRGYFIEAMERARENHGFHLWAYVIMPEHAHVLLWPNKEIYDISEILKSIKQSVARRAVLWLRKNNPAGLRWMATGQTEKPYAFWQDGGGYDRNVRHAKALTQMIDYIHNNPVQRGLVSRPEDWPWSSAPDWAGVSKGPIRLDMESCKNSLV